MSEHMDKVRERVADPAFWTGAEARGKKIEANLRASPVNLMAEALQDAQTAERRVFWLRSITATLGVAAAGIVPCKAGCDACCHMATMISVHEADRIAKHTARPRLDAPDRDNKDDIEDDKTRYSGVPCAFLVDHKCSIYGERPHVCRVHYTVDRDNLLCQIVPGEAVNMPMIDNMSMNMLALIADGDPADAKMADIRDYFPPVAE